MKFGELRPTIHKRFIKVTLYEKPNSPIYAQWNIDSREDEEYDDYEVLWVKDDEKMVLVGLLDEFFVKIDKMIDELDRRRR